MGTTGLLPEWFGQLVSGLPFVAMTALALVAVARDRVADSISSGDRRPDGPGS